MCLSAFMMVAMGSTYKVVAQEGFHIVDFALMRCLSSLTISSLLCLCFGTNPITELKQSENKKYLLLRCIMGHAYYTLTNLAMTMAPLSMVFIFL